MSVKSAQPVTVLFCTANATTGAAADATGTPAGTLYVNGTANAATVTVTNLATGLYKAAVTLPSLTAGDVVSLRIAATVATIAGEGIIWQEVADTERVSDLNDPTAATVATAVRSELAPELARVDAPISSRNATAPLDSAATQAATAAALNAYDPPTKAELDSAVAPLATAAALDIVDNLLDNEIGAIKTVTDKLDTALVLDGAVYQYTANALEQGPGGGTTADPLLNEVPGDYPPNSAGAALGNIAGATVAIVSPVSADGTEIGPLIYGDDYAAADNRALVFATLPGPTLTGGAITLRIQARNGAVSIAGIITGAHAGYVELTAAQVTSIGIGTFKYDLEATLSVTGNIVTLVTGRATIIKDVR